MRELLTDVEVNGLHVRIEHITDTDGNHAIQITGIDCNLEGELPGLYYPTPLHRQPDPDDVDWDDWEPTRNN